jgi:hypothetical protein
MLACSNCGYPNRYMAKFCVKCGNTIKGKNKPVLPQTSFSFLGHRFPTLLIAGFILGFITFAIIGLSSSSDPYGCTQCDPFLPGYDGPPPIEMDLGIDPYAHDDYYYDDYYYP